MVRISEVSEGSEKHLIRNVIPSNDPHMETKLYNRLFVRLEELGAIRKTPVLVFA